LGRKKRKAKMRSSLSTSSQKTLKKNLNENKKRSTREFIFDELFVVSEKETRTRTMDGRGRKLIGWKMMNT